MTDSPSLTVRPEVSHIHKPDSTAEPITDLLKLKDHFTSHTPTVELKDLPQPSNIAQTSMIDSPSLMVRPEASHTHKLDSTAEPTTVSPKSQRALPGQVARSLTHNSRIIPKQHPKAPRTAVFMPVQPLQPLLPKDHFMNHTNMPEPKDSALISNIAQISTKDSLSLMVRPKAFHTHKLDSTAEPTTVSPKRNEIQEKKITE